MKQLPVLIVILIAVLGCKYIRPEQKLDSEAAAENPNKTITESPVFKNGEPFGTTADLGRLKSTLREIMRDRENNGIFIEGTTEVANNVYLIADPELAVGALAALHMAIDESSGRVRIPKQAVPTADWPNRKPNPLFLAVTTGPLDRISTIAAENAEHDRSGELRFEPAFEVVKTRESLVSHRAWTGSVELSADERYFVNDAQGSEADEGPKYTQVMQRPIDPSALETELAKIVEPVNKEVLIIASEKASYASLLKVFEAAPKGVRLRILVRPHELK